MDRFSLIARSCLLSLAACLAIAALTGCAPETAALTVTNSAGEEISEASVDVCGQHFVFKGIKPTENRVLTFEIRGDCDYQASIAFASGRHLEGRDGYATVGGYTTHDYLTVYADHINVTSEVKHAE